MEPFGPYQILFGQMFGGLGQDFYLFSIEICATAVLITQDLFRHLFVQILIGKKI